MSAVYPGTVRSFDTKIDLEDTVFALHINDLQDEVVAIQNVLGTSPQGAATGPATVGKRITDLENGKATTTHTHDTGAAWVGLTTTNHDVEARHTYGAAYGNPATPTTLAVGGASTVGTGDNPAREDHGHGLPSATTIASAVIPAGTIVAYGGTSAPAGWVFCDGTSYSTGGAQAALFAAIAYRYGGSGANFNVPELRSKFPMGQATTGAAVSTGGFTDAALVSHNHPTSSITTAAAGSHRHGFEHGHGFYDPGHVHNFGNRNPNTVFDGIGDILVSRGDATSTLVDYNRGSPNGRDLITYVQILNNGTNASVNGTGPINTGWEVDTLNHSHPLTIALEGIAATNRNLPPYQTVNYIIKL